AECTGAGLAGVDGGAPGATHPVAMPTTRLKPRRTRVRAKEARYSITKRRRCANRILSHIEPDHRTEPSIIMPAQGFLLLRRRIHGRSSHGQLSLAQSACVSAPSAAAGVHHTIGGRRGSDEAVSAFLTLDLAIPSSFPSSRYPLRPPAQRAGCGPCRL